VEQARTALLKHDWQKLGMLMNDNHKILQELGVSTGKLDRMCWAALGAGAYGAKLSGAGGGDCMIALVDPKKKDLIEKALIKAGGQILPLNTGATGVRLEGL